MKLGTREIPTEEIGDTWTLSAVVYDNGKEVIALTLPFANIKGLPMDVLYPSDEEFQAFLKQTDDPVTPVLTPEGLAFVRKCTRQVIESVRWRVYKRDNYACRYCGRDDVPMTVDHYIAQKYGGEWTFENLLTCCRHCQKLKGHMTVEQWKQFVADHPKLKLKAF